MVANQNSCIAEGRVATSTPMATTPVTVTSDVVDYPKRHDNLQDNLQVWSKIMQK